MMTQTDEEKARCCIICWLSGNDFL
jgi:hypothetical protein